MVCASNPKFLSLLCGFDEFCLMPQRDVTSLVRLSGNIATIYPLMGSNDGHPVDGCFHLQSVYFGHASETPIVFDTGASTGVTPHRQDFEVLEEVDAKQTGIAQKTQVKGSGYVKRSIRDDLGKIHHLRH
jgi:hypothetical protein